MPPAVGGKEFVGSADHMNLYVGPARLQNMQSAACVIIRSHYEHAVRVMLPQFRENQARFLIGRMSVVWKRDEPCGGEAVFYGERNRQIAFVQSVEACRTADQDFGSIAQSHQISGFEHAVPVRVSTANDDDGGARR